MSRRKKRKSLRNKFTDALTEEISARKIIEKTQPKAEEIVETEVEVAAVEVVEEIAEVIEEPIEIPKIDIPEKIEVEPENEFEKKVFAEADNDFFDEKPIKKSDAEKTRQSIYHSRALRKWQEEFEEDNAAKNPIEQVEDTKEKKLSRAEKAGVVISIAMMIYGIATIDKPLFFLAASLAVHLVRPFIGRLSGKYNDAVQNALRSFSLVLFCGAILFLFLGI